VRISEALPNIFNRTYPVLEPKTQMLLAVSLLRFHQIDALPIGFRRLEKKKYAVFGYSTLSTLLETKPTYYGRFLEQPCESTALKLSIISATKSVESLLQVFKTTKFGFAWVEGRFEMGGFAALRDLLPLYDNSVLKTDLTVGEVASPIVSLPADTSLKDAIEEMFKHRFRRVFVGTTGAVVSDRKIIGYVFSTSRLSEVSERPEALLDASIGDLDGPRPLRISAKSSIKKAAKIMRGEVEECLICENGVITPWDLIMKPWLEKKLAIVA
jgi:CBS domain-containing protein